MRAICGEEEEIALHNFRDCQMTKVIAFASKWELRMDVLKGSNQEEVVEGCFNFSRDPLWSVKTSGWFSFQVMVALLYSLYEKLFEGKQDKTLMVNFFFFPKELWMNFQMTNPLWSGEGGSGFPHLKFG